MGDKNRKNSSTIRDLASSERAFPTKNELDVLRKGQDILTFNVFLEKLKNKYKLSSEELLSLLHCTVPEYIFVKELTTLEAVVKYLKEQQHSFSKIALLIGRDARNVWNIYDKSCKKYAKAYTDKKPLLRIPVSIFDSDLSAFESLVLHLSEKLSVREISVLLKRDYQTIWTVMNRAKKKRGRDETR